jgi:hypothetical protein
MQQMLSKHLLAKKYIIFLLKGVFVTNLGIQHMYLKNITVDVAVTMVQISWFSVFAYKRMAHF